MSKRVYGWNKTKEKMPEKYVTYEHKVRALPTRIDLTALCGPVLNQQDVGCCSGASAAGLANFTMRFDRLGDYVPSMLAIYYFNRMQLGTTGEDSGATIYSAIKSLTTWGAPHENLWTFANSASGKYSVKPTPDVWSDGYWHVVKDSFYVPQTLNAIKSRLAEGMPILYGFTVFESFESDAVAKTGIVPMPKNGENQVGGHAVYMIGYDDTTKMFKTRNSWTEQWGDQGNFYMPYEYILNPQLAQSFWSIQNFVRFKGN